jgi:N12 class adenine-specific DNA methylase
MKKAKKPLIAVQRLGTTSNRERFFSRVATGDWDAVIVAHSSFKKIDMPHDIQQQILQEQIDAVVDAIANAKEQEGSRATVKQLEKQRDKIRARYDKLIAMSGAKDRSVDFADLGVDALFVDESHEFKNLAYVTSMNVSGLGNITGSAKALDLYIKCRYLQEKNQGRGVYFMTGTPISNTIAEVYTLQRYLQYGELQNKGIEYFDAWASTFGQVTAGWELDATGVNYTRLFWISLALIRHIMLLITAYYLYFTVLFNPVYTPCIRRFSGYYSGYRSHLTKTS